MHIHIHACCVFKSHACLGTSDLLSTMNKWSSQSNWSRNLHKLIYKFNMTLPVKMESLDLPVRWRNKHVLMPWPCLPFRSWASCVFDKTCGQPLLAGKKISDDTAWKHMFRSLWSKFEASRGNQHPVFTDHVNELELCCPIMIHGDEGRRKLHRAVMATSIQPVLVQGGHAGHSFNSRFLHSIMPGELYEGDHTVQLLQEALVEDLRDLYTNGLQAFWLRLRVAGGTLHA